jgi:autoinducer 2-degrading protein
MTGYVITVDFSLKPGSRAAFRRLVDHNARESCRNEPGCRRFDVLSPKGEADRVLLYEIYADRAAFDAHLKTPHYDVFNRESAGFILEKKIAEFELACEGSQT